MPVSNTSISGFTPVSLNTVAKNSINWGEFSYTIPAKLLEPVVKDAISGSSLTGFARASQSLPARAPVES